MHILLVFKKAMRVRIRESILSVSKNARLSVIIWEHFNVWIIDCGKRYFCVKLFKKFLIEIKDVCVQSIPFLYPLLFIRSFLVSKNTYYRSKMIVYFWKLKEAIFRMLTKLVILLRLHSKDYIFNISLKNLLVMIVYSVRF
jgi:hypothetical protein